MIAVEKAKREMTEVIAFATKAAEQLGVPVAEVLASDEAVERIFQFVRYGKVV